MRKRLIIQTCIILLTLVTSSCGGSGGSSDLNQPAELQIDASPRRLDTRDRLLIKIYIQDVHQDGIILKIRTPTELDYLNDSAILTQSGDFFRIQPIERGRGRAEEERNYDYIVFSLPRTLFDFENEAELVFEMTADGAVEQGYIEVDADVNHPLIDDRDEFQFSNPDFTAEATVEISILD